MSFAPHAAHHRDVARYVDADQIGALADRDLAPVIEADRLRGVLVTVRIADGRSMAGTRCGNCSAAIKRLEGI